MRSNLFSIIIPANCTWSEWVCGDCLVTCGDNAVKNCFRKIRRPAMTSESGILGAQCDGEAFETRPCEDLEPCPIKIGLNL